MKRILVTGASGFIGSFIVEEALRQGYETWAAMRLTSSKAYLQDERIHFVELNLAEPETLKAQLKACGRFDYSKQAFSLSSCNHSA